MRTFPAVMALLPALLAGCRQEPAESAESDYIAPPIEAAQLGLADREKVKQFWSTYHRAAAENQAGRWARAAELYSEALRLDSKHWDSMYYLGNSMVELGRFDEAYIAYKRLADSDPQAARAYSALGGLHSNERAGKLFDLGAAEKMYHRAWRSNGDESGSVLRLGEICLAAGKLEKAREYLEAAARTNPKSLNARLLQGYIAWKRGDSDRAESFLRQAVAITKQKEPAPVGLSEGDTNLPGAKPIVRTASKGLFDDLSARLASAPAGQTSETTYRDVDARIRQISSAGTASRT